MTHGTRSDAVGERTQSIDTDADGFDDLLSDPHCRYLLAVLDDADGEIQISTAARHVVAGITDTEPEAVSADVARRVQTWLHHGQLPRLVERGIVEYDPDTNTVALAAGSTV